MKLAEFHLIHAVIVQKVVSSIFHFRFSQDNSENIVSAREWFSQGAFEFLFWKFQTKNRANFYWTQ